ncbi:MAG: NAD-dependent epimerase [Nitrospina sp.]|nr:NAD-dependent epimerase [Nitrospina sp.]MBT3875001.1 NAD-dependent epimerase [Nitrospina sp.]MBT4049652.1 NAD-dependent epimerase [Nitrospina sp.]MBT4556351.1 NAD-dependent epimerase [Nitrospina sp.]MBT5348166.1 NAD-dependent epimerase [Nitrospina sp.]
MKILVTGAAGFIGFHIARRLLEDGYNVIGLDNVNDYYDVKLKRARLKILQDYKPFSFYENNLEDKEAVDHLFKKEALQRVIHLAAQAGVRYSIQHPEVYIQSNIVGTFNILEACRHNAVEHLVYASTSSAYGLNTKFPFSVHDNVSHPVSFYGATKIANELMAHSYSHLYGLPTTGLRFFTVYGPWGRPDMALFLFTKAILASEAIDLYNQGDMVRDFTYIDDIVEGLFRIVKNVPEPDPEWSGDTPNPASSSAPYRLYNIGSNSPVPLMDYVREIEKNLGMEAKLNLMPMQDGDVRKSHADVENLIKVFDYAPKWNIKDGIKNFIQWYVDYYKVSLPTR